MRGTDIWKYEADTVMFNDTITLQFKAGRYEARWYDPSAGDRTGKPVAWKQKDGDHTFYTPPFISDIALKITGKK